MSKRTRYLLGIGVIAALVLGWQIAAFAVHDEGVFELEGNVVDDAVAGDDWETVFEALPDPPPGADESAFVAEPNPQASFFTGGGSKDPEDLPAWKWKDDVGGLPDKSNLTNSFAASYTVGGHELVYFGADRFDGSGDAAIAFWFLQDEVAQTPASGSGGTFTGNHQENDVLVISNFSNGGSVSNITVYEWDAPGIDDDNQPDPNDPGCTKAANNNPQAGQCGAANLRVLTTLANADCDTIPTGTNDNACATVDKANDNKATVWPFDNKDSGTADNTEYLPGELFEGGVDLTDLGLGGQCFASLVAETRTSTSPTSVLKDFTVGPFGDCEAGMTTQASKLNTATPPAPVAAGTVTPGTTVFDIASIQGSGTTPLIDPTGTVDFFLCGPGQLNDVDAAGCSVKENDPDTAVGTDKAVSGGTNTTDGLSTAQSDNVNTASSPLGPGKYCFRAEYSGDTNYDLSSETNATTECFTVADTFTISTKQRFIPQDSATITLQSGGTPAGTVAFRLYNSLANCQANGATGLLYAEGPVTVSGGTASTNNDGVPATGTPSDGDAGYSVESPTTAESTTNLWWNVAFTPTNSSITGTQSVCKEDSTVRIDDTTAPTTT